MSYDIDGGVWAEQNPYPAARTTRGRGIPTNSAAPSAVTLPNVRHWSGAVETGLSGRRSQLASPRFAGPVLLDTLFMSSFGVGRSTPISEFWIYADTSAFASVVNSTLFPAMRGTPVFERSRGGTNEDTGDYSGGSTVPILLNTQGVTWKLRKYIAFAEVFLCVGIGANIGGAWPIYFSLRILENVDPQTAGELLNS